MFNVFILNFRTGMSVQNSVDSEQTPLKGQFDQGFAYLSLCYILDISFQTDFFLF